MSIVTWEFESPPLHTFYILFAEIAQLVEHNLAKVGVAGPSPVFRSFFVPKNILKSMNLYLRYFDNETLVHSVEDAIDFLSSIPDINMNAELEADIRDYASSDVFYPKRYKVRSRVYFIIIKTLAETMFDFKQKKAVHPNVGNNANDRRSNTDWIVNKLCEEKPGWYEGELDFKRVVMVPSTGKFEYRDTKFVARCKANSGMDCYNRIIDNLRDRVDGRSQFPSAKGKNFRFTYLGMWK